MSAAGYSANKGSVWEKIVQTAKEKRPVLYRDPEKSYAPHIHAQIYQRSTERVVLVVDELDGSIMHRAPEEIMNSVMSALDRGVEFRTVLTANRRGDPNVVSFFKELVARTPELFKVFRASPELLTDLNLVKNGVRQGDFQYLVGDGKHYCIEDRYDVGETRKVQYTYGFSDPVIGAKLMTIYERNRPTLEKLPLIF
ncbi:MAG: hypothetical protein ABI432_16860 [Flavobacteriales bacterium]